jgi:4,5-DOPA dioxygenase extradiol
VPVLQVALQPALGAAHHLRLGRALAPLADEDVLLLGSGHMTHNLPELMQLLRRGQAQFGEETSAAPYVTEFCQWVDSAVRAQGAEGRAALSAWESEAPHAPRAHPTSEHFLPLLVARAAAGDAPDVARVDLGVEAQVLAMDAYVFTPRT